MKTFKELTQEINENAAVYASSAILSSRVARLAQRIRRERDPKRRDELIAQQNKDIAYMNGINTSIISKGVKEIKDKKK